MLKLKCLKICHFLSSIVELSSYRRFGWEIVNGHFVMLGSNYIILCYTLIFVIRLTAQLLCIPCCSFFLGAELTGERTFLTQDRVSALINYSCSQSCHTVVRYRSNGSFTIGSFKKDKFIRQWPGTPLYFQVLAIACILIDLSLWPDLDMLIWPG